MTDWSGVGGVNEGYVLELYERFRQDPSSVHPPTRAAFEASPPSFADTPPASRPEQGRPVGTIGPGDVRTIVGAVNLAEAIRRYGHLGAQLDPLGTPPWGDPSLAPEAHGISRALPRPRESARCLRAARSHHRGRDLRALPPSCVPRQDPLLGRRRG